ncbi:MAG: substrate-binding domain-containing protein, partial [Candidatus Korarchaeota archaeon]|nr:substrate-binding domain-containing protein [Candidatus Korarchaeota archaeon]
DACRAVAEGRADITLTIRPVAEIYGLKFVPIGWERYDLVVSERIKEDMLASLLDAIRRERPPAGYRVEDDLGERIF